LGEAFEKEVGCTADNWVRDRFEVQRVWSGDVGEQDIGVRSGTNCGQQMPMETDVSPSVQVTDVSERFKPLPEA